MAFCSPKACGGVAVMSADIGCLFLFASDIGFPLSVGRPEVRPTNLRMMAIPTSVAFPAELMRGENPMN